MYAVLNKMWNDEDVIIAAAAFIVISTSKRKSRRRRFWVRPSLRHGKVRYSGSQMLQDFKLDDVDPLSGELRDSGTFKNFTRISSVDFENLLGLIGPKIHKEDTNYRLAVPVKERLAITLRFLATGDSFHSLMYLFKVSKQAISNIIPEVCEALIDALKDYVKLPNTAEEWKSIANNYNTLWNFPNCCGAMDGKHIALQAPHFSGSEFFNSKQFFSIVLFAVVDANYKFIYVDVGCQGRISDGGVFNNTSFQKSLERCTLNLPQESVLPGMITPQPYVFLADDAFPLTPNIMKPYPGVQEKGSKTRIFNYRLSRARRVVENAFGIISAVFRVLRKPLLLQPERADKIVLACVYLHNYLRRNPTARNAYTPPGTFDTEDKDTGEIMLGSWRKSGIATESLLPLQKVARKSSRTAQDVRSVFKEYFITNEGQVPWQDRYC